MTETVLITGAGSGIGLELTRLFARDGARIVAASLLPAELDALVAELSGKAEVIAIPIDLSQPGAAARLVAECDSRGLEIDTLVNNAGFACFGDVVENDLVKVNSMIALNITTLTELSALFGARMKQKGRGSILNVGSTAGMMPATRMAAYCASKAYVNAFTWVLAAELAPYGVTVTCLAPGATGTNFAKAGGIEEFQGQSMLKSMFEKGKAGSPALVAKDAYAALRKGKRMIVTGKGAGFTKVLSRLIPPHRLPGMFKNV